MVCLLTSNDFHKQEIVTTFKMMLYGHLTVFRVRYSGGYSSTGLLLSKYLLCISMHMLVEYHV